MDNCNSNNLFGKTAPGEKISKDICAALGNANRKKKDFPSYLKEIESIFKLTPLNQLKQEDCHFLAGFIEGEGSFNVSAKKLDNAVFGLMVDPEFSITQHVSGISNLHAAMVLFKAGRLRYKSGSNATMVFVIDNRRSIQEKVIPFVQKYSPPFASPVKKERLKLFSKVLGLLESGGHKDINIMKEGILPVWDQLRMQKGQSNASFENLEEAQDFVQAVYNKSQKK